MMVHGGLVKLVEECGEVVQVAAKKIAYPAEPHPDGGGELNARLEDELADLLAAIEFVSVKLGLDAERMRTRVERKFAMFEKWSNEA